MARRATLRASDSDRETVADRLRAAAAEGRLLTEELEERLARAFRARTYGELDSLTADLPHEQLARGRGARRLSWRIGPVPAVALLLMLPLAFALVLAVIAIVFAMLTAWTVMAAAFWLMSCNRSRWYGPRLSYGYRRLGRMRRYEMYGPRRAHQRSGLRL